MYPLIEYFAVLPRYSVEPLVEHARSRWQSEPQWCAPVRVRADGLTRSLARWSPGGGGWGMQWTQDPGTGRDRGDVSLVVSGDAAQEREAPGRGRVGAQVQYA